MFQTWQNTFNVKQLRIQQISARLITQLFFIALGFLTTAISHAAPESDLWPKWQAHDAASTDRVDHDPWQTILDRYLVTNIVSTEGINRFNYAELAKDQPQSAQDRQTLTAYLDRLQDIKVTSLNRNEQMAYWINLYNALTVQRILKDYPVKSITKLGGFFSFGPWNEKIAQIEGETLTLNDIEHRILRPIWQDYRIHFVVNCASIGCPQLSSKAYQADTLEAQLEKSAVDFLNHPRAVSLNGGALTLSKLFEWYQVDFGSNEAEILSLIHQYRPDLNLLKTQIQDIEYFYDWNLNAP